MARIKAANANPVTEQVVEKMVAVDTERIEKEKAFQKETDEVCTMLSKCRRAKEHPEVFATDTMVELVARVPARVAESAVREMRFRDKYPCLSAFAFGILTGMGMAAVSVMMVVML